MRLAYFTRCSRVRTMVGWLMPRGLVACRRGAAAVEFALASIPLVMMILGFVATNSVFLALSTMQGSTLNAAMLMSSGQITSFQSRAVTCSSSLGTTTAEYYACQG